ncbi:hypothetical protein VTN31DRAFT_5341 [Thermomyces dupontii]|uniref:uncharacterized protein n=1 Tax=Talaromyces thermophilus TaxID=28565 RepID=UPI0037422964
MGSRPSSECPTEPASPVQERLVWEEQIRGRLAYTETGSVGSLHLTVLPVEDGLTLADRIRRALWERPMANGSFALTMAKEKANCDPVSEFPIKPEESPLNCDTPIPLTNTHLSDLAPGINPAPGLGSVLIGRVLLPPADYKTPSGCRAVMPALRTAQMVLNVCTAETGRQGGYGLLRDEQGTPSVGKIRLPDGLNYDSPDDCKLAAHWFKLAELVIGERAEALSCGDPVPPVVGHAHGDLAREGRLFREPLQEGDSVTGMGKRLQGSTRARGRPRKRRRQW